MLDLTEKRVFFSGKFTVVCRLTKDGSLYPKPLLGFSNSHRLSIPCVPVCPYPEMKCYESNVPLSVRLTTEKYSHRLFIPRPYGSNPTPGPCSPISDTPIVNSSPNINTHWFYPHRLHLCTVIMLFMLAYFRAWKWKMRYTHTCQLPRGFWWRWGRFLGRW